jgi:hypothetical protein
MVKWLRHRPFTAVTGVRIPLGSPGHSAGFSGSNKFRSADIGEVAAERLDFVPDDVVSYLSVKSGSVAQLVEQRTENPRVGGSIPSRATTCGSGSGVEHRLAKARVAGSNPVFRSTLSTYLCRDVAQPGSALPWGGRGPGFKSRHSDHLAVIAQRESTTLTRWGS